MRMTPTMIRPVRMVFPLVSVPPVCRAPACTKCTDLPGRGQKKPRRLGGASGAGADTKTQGRGSCPWWLREVSQPWMPLRASDVFDADSRGKFQGRRKKFIAGSFDETLTRAGDLSQRSEENTSELQSLIRTSYS